MTSEANHRIGYESSPAKVLGAEQAWEDKDETKRIEQKKQERMKRQREQEEKEEEEKKKPEEEERRKPE